MTNNKARKALLLAALTTLIIACKREQDPCLQPRVVNLRAHAYHHADTGTAIYDTLLPKAVLVALDAPAVGNAFLYSTKTATLTFTLNDAADSARWLVIPDSANYALQDTITFHYSRQLSFLSNACGYTYFYHLQQIGTTRHALDSVLITHADVTSTANVEHVSILY